MAEKTPLDRRGFLKAVGLGGGAAAAAVVVAAPTTAEAAGESRADRIKARYKETDHVKAFYRTNRY